MLSCGSMPLRPGDARIDERSFPPCGPPAHRWGRWGSWPASAACAASTAPPSACAAAHRVRSTANRALPGGHTTRTRFRTTRLPTRAERRGRLARREGFEPRPPGSEPTRGARSASGIAWDPLSGPYREASHPRSSLPSLPGRSPRGATAYRSQRARTAAAPGLARLLEARARNPQTHRVLGGWRGRGSTREFTGLGGASRRSGRKNPIGRDRPLTCLRCSGIRSCMHRPWL